VDTDERGSGQERSQGQEKEEQEDNQLVGERGLKKRTRRNVRGYGKPEWGENQEKTIAIAGAEKREKKRRDGFLWKFPQANRCSMGKKERKKSRGS